MFSRVVHDGRDERDVEELLRLAELCDEAERCLEGEIRRHAVVEDGDVMTLAGAEDHTPHRVVRNRGGVDDGRRHRDLLPRRVGDADGYHRLRALRDTHEVGERDQRRVRGD